MKRFLILMCLVCTVFSMTACTAKKDAEVDTYGMRAIINKELLLRETDLLIRGEITQIDAPYFTNPNGDKKLEDGSPAVNAYVTVYTVEIAEIYKGQYDEKTIRVPIYNKCHMTVEEVLAEESGEPIVISDIPDVVLDKGECILSLHYYDIDSYGGAPGYGMTFDESAYFLEQPDGSYKNQSRYEDSVFSFTKEELEKLKES